MNVYLVGMPGSGKTAVGRELARRTGLRFVDLDAAIEAASGMGVHEIFAAQGEPGFRELEREALRRVSGGEASVVACGGGIVLDRENRRLLRNTGTVVWLVAPPERLRGRIRPGTRPLLQEDDDLDRLYAEREPLYRQVADRVIDATASPGRVAGAIQRGMP